MAAGKWDMNETQGSTAEHPAAPPDADDDLVRLGRDSAATRRALRTVVAR